MEKYILDLLDDSDQQFINFTQKKYSDRVKDLYQQYARPETGNYLRIMNLDKHFDDGYQNYLIYKNEEGKEIKVLDMTGGYGANLLGHKNPNLINALIHAAQNLAPSHTQAALRKVSSMLCRELSENLFHETGIKNWVTTLSNSGAEAVEAALKICLLHTAYKKQFINDQLTLIKNFIEKTEVQSTEYINFFSNTKLLEVYKDLSKEALLEKIIEKNKNYLSEEFPSLALKGAYHGKTMGALNLTYNQHYKHHFLANSQTKYVDENNLAYVLNSTLESIYVLDPNSETVQLMEKKVSKLNGCFIEAIQGEGGVQFPNTPMIQKIREFCNQYNLILVADEIQAGLYRAKTFTATKHHGIHADVYTFSKGLGGGVVKIAATSCRQDLYPKEFSMLHTSTFCEDDISSWIGLKVLEILKRDQNNFHQVNLVEELMKLQQKYPKVIKEVRGLGYMAAIDFNPEIAFQCIEFKIFEQIGFLGYLLSSGMLANNQVRTMPSLSSPMTLRLQPSLYFKKEDCDWLLKGLEALTLALQNFDMKYFFGHFYPGEEIVPPIKVSPLSMSNDIAKKPLAVFFCHMIHENHAKMLVKSHSKIDNDVLKKKLMKVADVLDFSVLHRQNVFDAQGKEIELIFMAHPITSEEMVRLLKENKSNEIVEKIQRGIDFVKDLGATTIGLGQFTSIVSFNGMKLDNRGLNLTTGNAFTTAMTVEAVKKAAMDQKIDLAKSHLACVGMAGNIASVTASVLSDYIAKMTFVYHTELSKSKKYQKTLLRFFHEIKESDSKSPFILKSKNILTNYKLLNENETIAITDELVKNNLLILTEDIQLLNQCDIVIAGASAPKSFIDPQIFKAGSIVVDIGVPANVQKEKLSNRKDIHYIQGGIANLPDINGHKQIISTNAFPLKPGTSYACLAETLILTMHGCSSQKNIGDLNKKMVLETLKMGQEHGVGLANFKLEDSL